MAAVRSPRGRFLLLFTVLISFCITASLTNDKTQILNLIKENLKYFEENLEKTKAAYEEKRSNYINGMNEFEKLLDPYVKEQREQWQSFPDTLLVPDNPKLEKAQVIMDSTRVNVNDEMVTLQREIAESERELESQRMKIKLIEEYGMTVHSEL